MIIRVTKADDIQYVDTLVEWYRESAKKRGVGIAERDPEYLKTKIENENAVIAFYEGNLAGFCYLEVFEDEVDSEEVHEVFGEAKEPEKNVKQFVVNSGLIVHPDYRHLGIAKQIKTKIFNLSRQKYPKAKIFSITTSLAVMKMNTELGYKPVTFSEITQSDNFWNGCKSCKNYSILIENQRKMCLCSSLVYENPANTNDEFEMSEAMKMKLKFSKEGKENE